MNNNQINFDPMTGQPIDNNNNINNQVQNLNQQQQVNLQNLNNNQNLNEVAPVMPAVASIEQPQTNNIQQQLSSIPTIEQNAEQFVNNTQATNTIKKEEKKEGPNIAFIVIIFAIIFAAIFFLFPYLLEIL